MLLAFLPLARTNMIEDQSPQEGPLDDTTDMQDYEDYTISVYLDRGPNQAPLDLTDMHDSLDNSADKMVDELVDKLLQAGRIQVAPYTLPTLPASGSLFSSLRSPVPVARSPLMVSQSPFTFPRSLPIAEVKGSFPQTEELKKFEVTGPIAEAHGRFLRSSPSKVRRVLDTIRDRSYEEALMILQFMPYRSVELITKVLRSAVANAEANLGLDKSSLIIVKAVCDGGPILKRLRPRAQGRAFPIKKRTSHISIYVAPGSKNRKVDDR